MRLTKWTDYSLRVLLYCATTQSREAPATIGEIATMHGISRSHLMKIVMTLSSLGWIESSRGRGGGIRLLKPASQITVGEVVRQTEADFHLVECFDAASNTCRLDRMCALKMSLKKAQHSFLKVLDEVSIADLVKQTSPLAELPLVNMSVRT